ncbi:DUF2785 domain-containing protein [Brassicibacter mesophilus]|uniref:DUF2785 domain-containing protein n=1 Tax=Brassicibacter mesophilus TaxID=745119 RepID=UPI003D20F9EF
MEIENQLKNRLLEIRKNEWAIPKGIDVWQFALEMMDNIGSTDPELRDELVLELVCRMIIKKVLPKEQIREILDISLSDKHLFHQLGEEDDDSVFNRAFTILVVRWIIYYHNTFGEDLLSEEEMLKVFEDVIRYVRLEKDTRGYVQDKGWAHAAAHSGDALRTFALCNYLKEKQLMQILEVIKEKANISYYVYVNEETERLTSAVVNVIDRNVLGEREVVGWIRSFEDIEKPSNYPEAHYWNENIKGLLRSLYFRLKFRKAPSIFTDEIEQVLNSINSFFNGISV